MPIEKPVAGYFKFWIDYEKEKFSQEFIDELKAKVPSDARSYDPATREWTIAELWLPEVRQVYNRYYQIPNHELFEEYE